MPAAGPTDKYLVLAVADGRTSIAGPGLNLKMVRFQHGGDLVGIGWLFRLRIQNRFGAVKLEIEQMSFGLQHSRDFWQEIGGRLL